MMTPAIHDPHGCRERRLVARLDKKLAEVIMAKAEGQMAAKVRFNRSVRARGCLQMQAGDSPAWLVRA